MSDRVRCNSCHGEYAPTGRDGTAYFHVCPPLSPWELDAAVAAGLVTLTKDELDEVNAGIRTVPRPLERDENVRGGHGDTARQAKADGTGVTPIAPRVAP